MARKTPEIMEVDTTRLDDVLERAENGTLEPADLELISGVFKSYSFVTELIGERKTTISRLRKMLFGSSSEKTSDILGKDTADKSSDSGTDPPDSARKLETSEEATSDTEPSDAEKPAPKGHGRNGAKQYKGAEQVSVKHQDHEPGDRCPDCQKGTLYETSRPGTLIRVTGSAPLEATVYELEKLRCQLCGKVFTAASPEGVGDEKYDASARAMIGLLRYGSGLPFNRLAGLQGFLHIPLPASTQWELTRNASVHMIPAYRELIVQAAQDDVLHMDDTSARILSLHGTSEIMEVNGRQAERSGVFTSGVLTTSEGREIALYFSGRKHAGENLRDILRLRRSELPDPIQMCDGASRNLPDGLNVVVSNCLVHARRNFVELYDNFPSDCRYVLEALKTIYANDAATKGQTFTPEERLTYHQEHSAPVMDDLHTWLNRQLDEKQVEPNSSLGTAIKYMLKRWEALTLFLRKPGAPLDNNTCERMLKKSILHRKNSLFFKTEKGAYVGDVFMSLIRTAELCDANPFEYLTALQEHGKAVAASPQHWMPWNYADTLRANTT